MCVCLFTFYLYTFVLYIEHKCDTPHSVCHIPSLCHQTNSLCRDTDSIATLPVADSDTVAGYLMVKLWRVLVRVSTILYLLPSDYCTSREATPVHWRLQMFQLTVNWHCSLIYQDVTKDVNWRNYCRLVFEGLICSTGIRVGEFVTLTMYLEGGTAVCFIPNVYIF